MAEVTRLGSGGHTGFEDWRLREREPIRKKEYGKKLKTNIEPSRRLCGGRQLDRERSKGLPEGIIFLFRSRLRFVRSWMRGFHDILREKLSSLLRLSSILATSVGRMSCPWVGNGSSHLRPKGTETGSKQEYDALWWALKRAISSLTSVPTQPSVCDLLEGSLLLIMYCSGSGLFSEGSIQGGFLLQIFPVYNWVRLTAV
jgi:hypothetical protein